MAAGTIPAPPKGFTLEDEDQGVPAPPPGFQLETAPSAQPTPARIPAWKSALNAVESFADLAAPRKSDLEIFDPLGAAATGRGEFGESVPQSAVKPLSAVNKVVQVPVQMGEKVASVTGPLAAGTLKLPLSAGGSHIFQPVREQPSPVTTGAATAVGEFAGSMVGNPTTWPFFASGAARPLLQKLITGGFRLGLTADAIGAAKDLNQNWDKYNPEQRSKIATRAGLDVLMTGTAGKVRDYLSKPYEALPSEPIARAEALFRNLTYKAGQSLPPNPTIEQANVAYRAAMANLHPDVNPAHAQDAQMLNDAWNVYRQSGQFAGAPPPVPPVVATPSGQPLPLPSGPVAPPAGGPPITAPMHEITMGEVVELGQKIAAMPDEARAQAMLAAHKQLAQEMLQQGRFVGPDGKIQIVTKPAQAETIAQKLLNESITKGVKQTEDSIPAPPEGFTVEEKPAKAAEARETPTQAFKTGDRVTLPNGDAGTVRNITGTLARVSLDKGGRVSVAPGRLKPAAVSGEAAEAKGPAGTLAPPAPETQKEAIPAPPAGFKTEPTTEAGKVAPVAAGEAPEAKESKIETAAVEDAKKGSILFARHGATKLDKEGGAETVAGWSDEPLDERGRKAAAELAQKVKDSGVTTIVTSDLPRAKETADIVAKELGVKVKTDERLRPQHLPETEGKQVKDIQQVRDYYEQHPDEVPKGGESTNQFRARQDAALADIEKQAKAGEKPMVVTHSTNLEAELGTKPEPGGLVAKNLKPEGGEAEPSKVTPAGRPLTAAEKEMQRPGEAKPSPQVAADIGKWQPPPELGAFSDREDIGKKARQANPEPTRAETKGPERRKVDRAGQEAEDKLFRQARNELGEDATTDQVMARVAELRPRESQAEKTPSPVQPKAVPGEPVKAENQPAGSAGTEKAPKYKFGNTQAPIPATSEAAQALKTARDRISDSDLAGKGKETDPHVTVRYGIKNPDDVKGIVDFLKQQVPFEASLGKTTSFPPSEHSDGASVIVAPIEAKELHRLNSELEKHGDFTEPSFKEYKPHATIAYVDPEKAGRYTGMTVTEGKKFTVDKVYITDREGNAEAVKLEGRKPGQAPKPIESFAVGQHVRFASDKSGSGVIIKIKGDNITVRSDKKPTSPGMSPEYTTRRQNLEPSDEFSQQMHVRQKNALTRALNQADPAEKRAAVLAAAKQAVKEWGNNAWPDDWSRWQRALDEVGIKAQLEDIETASEADLRHGPLVIKTIHGTTEPVRAPKPIEKPQTKISEAAELREASDQTLQERRKQLLAAIEANKGKPGGTFGGATEALNKQLDRVHNEQMRRLAEREAKTPELFHAIGQDAFDTGKKRVPAHDPKLMDFLKGADAATINRALSEWLKGWDEANLAAPVEKPAPALKLEAPPSDIGVKQWISDLPSEQRSYAKAVWKAIQELGAPDRSDVHPGLQFEDYTQVFANEHGMDPDSDAVLDIDEHLRKVAEGLTKEPTIEQEPVREQPKEQPARTAGGTEEVSGVSGTQGQGGNARTPVPAEGGRGAEGERPSGRSSGQPDRERLERPSGREGEGGEPARSGGGGAAKHPAPKRTAGGTGPTGSTGADGRRIESPTPEEPEEARTTAAELRNQRNYHISDEEAAAIGAGGEKTKIRGNLDALETFKKIQAEGREVATPEEQNTLAKYVDFGGLVGMLENPYSYEYREHTERFNKILTPAEIKEIKETLPNTHYTSMQMVDWVWKAMQRLGFKGGRYLEPGMGIGNFVGRTPEKIANRSEIYGVERNPLTGGMAKLLYPDAKIQVKPFQEFIVPNNSFDAAIGNVPFQDVTINNDPPYRDLKLNLHNYFIVKTLDKLKPGGIAALITSRYTLDSAKGSGYRAREEMAKRADLIAAIRLPNTAFKGNARTEVVADLLIFQKRGPGATLEKMPDWIATVPQNVGSQTYTLNKYIVDNPDHVLGEHSDKGSMYRENEYTVKPPADFTEALNKAMELLPRTVFGKVKAEPSALPPSTLEPEGIQFAPEDVKPGAFFRDADGKIKIKESGVAKDLPEGMRTKAIQEHLGAAIDLRDTVNRAISVQLETSDDEPLKAVQADLEKQYKSYVKKYGNTHSPLLAKIFKHDPEYGKLLSLESVDPESKEITKAAIFTKRVLAPYEPLRDLPDEPKSAMLKVMAERGFLDTKLMADLLKKPEADVVKNLEKEGLIYQDPHTGGYHPADEYLSGNVREKLKEAERARESDPRFDRNVEALKKVQPKPLTIHEIQPNLGQTWIPMKVYKGFLAHLAGSRVDVNISRDSTGRWLVQASGNKFKLEHEWQGGGIPGHKLVQYALNQQQPTVYDTDSDGVRHFNPQATTAAREKLAMIKEEFSSVLRRANQKVIDELEQIYNDTFNGYRLREFNGEHLDFPGMSEDWRGMIRGYQKAAVWRLLQEGRGGIFHAPGLGKTLTMATTGMEARRLKLSRKNMYAVPNHMVPQWREDFKRFYPNANVLAVTDEDFTPVNRAQLMSRIATGDWDAVIVPHSQFDLLPMSPEWEKKSIDKRLEDYREVLSELDEENDRRTIKQIEKAIDKLESRLLELNAKRKDNTISFDQMGIDMLFVDEAHAYKSMAVPTKMGNIGGISNSASQRAFALEMKANYLRDTHKGRGLVFGTGTPITNTVGELYVMTKYLAPEMLEAAGIRSFDDWAANFAQTVTNWEYAPDGVTFKPKTTLSEFTNVPELSTMFRRYAEYLSKEAARQLSNLKEPTAKRQDHMATITGAQEPLLDMVAERGDHLIKNPPKTREERMEDNWLKLSGDARKISLDARLYDPSLPDEPESKANQAVRVIKDVLDRTKAEKGTVAVFSDFFQHKDKAGKVDFNLFEDMKDKLVKAGVPASEVAIIHDVGDNKDKKELLFSRVRSGKVRVIFGSTEKMGIGTNIQARLKAELHLDQPWRPDQVEQREGRIIRSGNMWGDVEIHRFIAEPKEGTVKKYDEDAEVPAAVLLKPGEHRPMAYPAVIDLNDGTRLALHKSFAISEEEAKKAVEEGKLNDLLAVKARGGEVEKPRPRAYDLQMYQQLARKANFQEQFLTGNYSGRTMEDVGGDVKLNSQMFQLGKAMATGNPDALRKMKVEHDLRTYSMLERNFQVERSKTQREQANAEYRIPLIQKRIKKLQQDVDTWAKAIKGEGEKDWPGLKVTIGDKTYQGKEGPGSLKEWLDSNPPIASITDIPITVGGLPTEITSRETMYLHDGSGGKYEKATLFEYTLAGEEHQVPYDEQKRVTHTRSFINSFAARARALSVRLENEEGNLQHTKEQLASLTEDLKRTSPYGSKVEAMEKEISELNKRLGISGPAEIDEGAAPSEEPETEKPVKQEAKSEKSENLVTGESGEASLVEPLRAAAEAAGTVGNYIRSEAHFNKIARDLHSGMYDLEAEHSGRVLEAVQTMEGVAERYKDRKGDFLGDAAQVYDHIEDPEKINLTPAQDDLFDDDVFPLMKDTDAKFKELKEIDGEQAKLIDNYVHRVVKGKGGWLDRIVSGMKKGTGRGNLLSKSAPQEKGRTMMAIESPEGDRRVISIKAGKATMWVDGEPTELGEIKNAKGKGEATNETFPEGEPNSIFYDEGKIVEGPDGYDWKITQATTREIEDNTEIRYYHNALASALVSNLQVSKALRAAQFIDSFKSSPQFKEIAYKGSKPPDGWRISQLPQMKDYYFEPHTAEVLDWYAERIRTNGDPGIMEKVGQFLRTAIFFNPLIHIPNISVHWAVERGIMGYNPLRAPQATRAGLKAINAVIHQNQDFLDALEAGAPMQSHRQDVAKITQLFFDQLTEGLEKKNEWALDLAKKIGMSPVDLIKGIYWFSGKATWVTNDIAILQSAYEKMAREPGMTLTEALKETSKHIPDYRLPTRMLNSRALSKLLSNPNVSMFMAYHYGAAKSYGEAAKSALGLSGPPEPPKKPPQGTAAAEGEPEEPRNEAGRTKGQEIVHGWELLATIGLVTFVLYPLLDKLVQAASGDKNARLRRAGAATIPYNIYQAATHQKSVGDVVQGVATPAIHTKTAAELITNRDFYSGKNIYDPTADWHTQGQQVGRYLMQAVSPIGQASRMIEGGEEGRKRFGWGLFGVSFPKSRAAKLAATIAMQKTGTKAQTPESRADYVERHDILDELRKGNRRPLEEAKRNHDIDHKQAHNIERRAKLDPLEDTVYNFSIAEVEKVLTAAKADDNEHDIKILEKVLREKRARAGYSWQQRKAQ